MPSPRADRIPRWFLPVTGDLRLGGHYQLEGNAGGEVQECSPPAGGAGHYRITWAYGGGADSWVTVRLAAVSGDETEVELEHIAKVADVPEEMWAQFGPSATGIGWDSGFLGLALHLGSAADGPTPEEGLAWMMSDEGKAFSRGSADGWAAAHVADGADADDRPRRPPTRPISLYAGESPGGDAGGLTATRPRRRGSPPSSPTARRYSRGGGAGAPATTAKDPAHDPLRRHHRTPRRDPPTGGEHPGARGRRPVDAAGANGRARSTGTGRRRCSGRSSCRTCRATCGSSRSTCADTATPRTHPIDATRGVRDFSDDVCAHAAGSSGIPTAHLVGWSMGAGVIMQYALDHPALSLTLESPVSPYGFGGTRRDGSRLTDDDAGTGGGVANPDFVQRLIDHDTSDEAPTSPRSVFRSGYVAPGYTTEHEDVWVESMLTTSTATGNYPGDSCPSENWPGFAAGTIGVLNTMAPKYFDVSGIVDLADEAAGPVDPRRRSTRSSPTRRSTTSTTSASSGSFPAGPVPTSRRRRRWCRRRAMCWTRTRRPAAR